MKNPQDLVQIIDKFLKYQENVKTFSVHSLKAYGLDLSQAYKNYQGRFSEDTLWVHSREALMLWAPLAVASRNRKIATLKSFYKWLYQEKYIDDDKSTRLVCPKVQRKIPHFISMDEAIACLKSFDSEMDSLQKQSELSMFLLLYGCGLRISEACGMEWKRINFDTKQIRIHGKGNKERVVSAPSVTFKALSKLKKLAAPGKFIFGEKPLNPRVGFEWIRQRGVVAGLMMPLHPHSLRHSFATHMLSSGSNLRVLQKILGHDSLRATEIYTHLSIDQLANTVDQFHPLSKRKVGSF